MLYDENTTCRQAVELWDKEEIVNSVEMGGLGPGYEQAIQILIFELLRDNLDKPLLGKGDPGYRAWSDIWGDETVRRCDEGCGGFSGAQVSAAKSIAINMLRKGYGAFLREVLATSGDDRIIGVNKFWPKAPEVVAI